MDFITDLPKVNGYDQIWVIVDRFTKMAHFIPLKNRQAHTLAITFIREIWRLHGLPMSVVSDRDTVFTSKLCSEVMRLLDVSQDMCNGGPSPVPRPKVLPEGRPILHS